MKIALPLTVVMFSLCSNQVFAKSQTITKEYSIGCSDEAVYDKLGKIMAQGDREAWKKLLLAAVVAGKCRMWQKGDTVYLDKAGFASHCLRPAGETECYWTPRESVE